MPHDWEGSITDLANPAAFFPTARALGRRIVAHVGPTNSGKTHAALAELRAARSGVYASPLRLLAWQVHDQLSAGLPCNLVTGQERRDEGAAHTACTVEMASLRAVVDVAVLDEIQLLADESRGWAFARALLGLPARVLHVAGDPAALPLLERIAAETGGRGRAAAAGAGAAQRRTQGGCSGAGGTPAHQAPPAASAGEPLEVRRYERLSPLAVARRPLASLAQVQSGDCVVAFGRREVLALRQEVEAAGAQRCCVVYGALPPDARQLQARLFNTPRSGFGVLAATDAVGMGLNLNIRRVVFTASSKFDGTCERPLTAAEVKQVAGRAGRFGSRFPDGVVSATSAADLAAVAAALAQPSEELAAAHLAPSLAQLEQLHGLHPGDALPDVLRRFADAAAAPLETTHWRYARFDEQLALACMLRHLPLSLREAWTFSSAPADPDDTPVAGALLQLATAFAVRRRVTPAPLLHTPLAEARSEVELSQVGLARAALTWAPSSSLLACLGSKRGPPPRCRSWRPRTACSTCTCGWPSASPTILPAGRRWRRGAPACRR